MRILFLFVAGTLFLTNAFAQKAETVYLDKTDSSANLYLAVYPPKQPWKGYMMLIPGMFQKPADVLVQTSLATMAAEKGIAIFIPIFKTGISSFGIDTATQASLMEMLRMLHAKHTLSGLPFFIGGFSIGGTAALKYAELALKNNYPHKPAALFAIDSPLDFERMYNTCKREMQMPGTSADIIAENNYMIQRFEKEFGGSPAAVQAAYHKGSVYSYHDSSYQAIRPLLQLPIRLYTEPDIHFALANGTDYWGMNAFDFAAITNDLTKLGSKKVQLITSTGKGFRKPANTRHPHSWSIAEPDELTKWLLEKQ